MKTSVKFVSQIVMLSLLFCAALASASSENQHTVGDVTIHYNAFGSSTIPSEVAAAYGLTRSKRTGLVNISVVKNGQSVTANIFGHGKNLLGQLKELSFKEIIEENSIYYIATFNYSNEEQVMFDLQVQAEKTGQLIPLAFKQQFFVD